PPPTPLFPYPTLFRSGDGLDLPSAYDAASRAVEHCRQHRSPVFLHIRTIRMLGHAGSDVETEYHTLAEIEAVEKMDPLLRSAELDRKSTRLNSSHLGI